MNALDNVSIATSIETLERPAKDTAKHGRRLTLEQVALISRLHAAGQTQVAIAKVIGCDQTAVSYTLEKFTDTTELAGKALKANALKAVENWSKAATKAASKGQHLAVKEFLEAAMPELRPAVGNGNSAQVVVMLGTSGQPLSPPTIVGESRVVSVVSADSAPLVLPAHASNSADHGET